MIDTTTRPAVTTRTTTICALPIGYAPGDRTTVSDYPDQELEIMEVLNDLPYGMRDYRVIFHDFD